jgi:spoIIIJ-associated protein
MPGETAEAAPGPPPATGAAPRRAPPAEGRRAAEPRRTARKAPESAPAAPRAAAPERPRPAPERRAAPAARRPAERASRTPAEGVEDMPSDRIPPDQAADAALAVVSTLVRDLGYEDARVERSDAWLPDELVDDESLVIGISGGGAGALLEHDTEGLGALQFLARLMLAKQLGGWVNLLVDVDGDRARRVQELVQLAHQSAELVERDGRPVSLPPMSAYDRRIVHIVLKDHPVVATQSIGTGPLRKVTVRRVDQLLPEL